MGLRERAKAVAEWLFKNWLTPSTILAAIGGFAGVWYYAQVPVPLYQAALFTVVVGGSVWLFYHRKEQKRLSAQPAVVIKEHYGLAWRVTIKDGKRFGHPDPLCPRCHVAFGRQDHTVRTQGHRGVGTLVTFTCLKSGCGYTVDVHEHRRDLSERVGREIDAEILSGTFG